MNERWKEAAISSSSASGGCDGPASRSSAKRGSVSAAAPKQQSTPGRTTSHVESVERRRDERRVAHAADRPEGDGEHRARARHKGLADRVRARRVHRAVPGTMPACTRPRSMHSPEMSSCAMPANVVVAEHTNAIASSPPAAGGAVVIEPLAQF